MATKQEIIDKIKSVYTLNTGVTDWDEIESYLIEATDSILENIYGDTIIETDAAPSIFTPVAGIEYNVSVQKVGRSVTIGGFIVNTSTVQKFDVLTISDNNFKPTFGKKYYGTAFTGNSSNQGISSVSIDNNIIGSSISTNILGGQILKFSITYNTEL